MKILKLVFGVLFLASLAHAQPSQRLIYVNSAPSGSCSPNSQAFRYVISGGNVGKLYSCNTTWQVLATSGGGSPAVPGGSPSDVQYNLMGAFAGSPNMKFVDDTNSPAFIVTNQDGAPFASPLIDVLAVDTTTHVEEAELNVSSGSAGISINALGSGYLNQDYYDIASSGLFYSNGANGLVIGANGGAITFFNGFPGVGSFRSKSDANLAIGPFPTNIEGSETLGLDQPSSGTLRINCGTTKTVLCNLTLSNVIGVSYSTATNCADSAGAATCGSAAAGAFVIDAGATSTVVSTTAVTANSEINIQIDDSLGTRLSVTCNTGIATAAFAYVSARTAGASFTASITGTVAVNPLCLTYSIVN